jgi:hypothetical protein
MIKNKNILFFHSNKGDFLHRWHNNRIKVARNLGYEIENFSVSSYYDKHFTFPTLERKWKKRDKNLLKFYDILGEKISNCDIFIHFNGAMIHPEFIEQFKDVIKVYNCSDDPDASNILSKPVAKYYDICAISNPSCIPLYKSWGCENVHFWPLGAFHYNNQEFLSYSNRDIPIIFIGSKYGTPNFRGIGRIFGLYNKKPFFKKLEKKFPFIEGYGYKWDLGYINDNDIPLKYTKSVIGINVHNSIGPINSRLYDLAAFGVCQICDNKKNLHHVFDEGKEIIGFDGINECVDKINYYLNNQKDAEEIGYNARTRYLKEYTVEKIWKKLFEIIEIYLTKAK